MTLFGRRNDPSIPEIEVRGDEFTVRQPDGEPRPAGTREQLEPILVPDASEHKGKIPEHTWGA